MSIKEAFLKKPSMLEDKFYNSNPLCDAWQEMKILDPNLEFLCARFNVDHEHFDNEKKSGISTISTEKRRKIMVLYQMIF